MSRVGVRTSTPTLRRGGGRPLPPTFPTPAYDCEGQKLSEARNVSVNSTYLQPMTSFQVKFAVRCGKYDDGCHLLSRVVRLPLSTGLPDLLSPASVLSLPFNWSSNQGLPLGKIPCTPNSEFQPIPLPHVFWIIIKWMKTGMKQLPLVMIMVPNWIIIKWLKTGMKQLPLVMIMVPNCRLQPIWCYAQAC